MKEKGTARRVVLVALVLLTIGVQVWPAWQRVVSAEHARDYATYHYAVQEAVDGGDPYIKKRLSRRAKAEGTRTSVHPYFYPPPFLLLLTWAVFSCKIVTK